MDTTRLSSKGQIILPQSVRESHHWVPGTEFIVEDTPDGVLLRPVKPFAPSRIEDAIGCTGYSGSAKSLDDMRQAIARGVKERHGRGRY